VDDETSDDSKPARIVGRRRPPEPLAATDDKATAIAFRRAFPTPFIPRGVYRFRSHEEADRWLWEMITRPRGT
jgi:hypothetical protein